MSDFTFEPIGNLGKTISVQKMSGSSGVYLRITKLYKTDEGTYLPTKQGVSVPAQHVQTLLTYLEQFIRENQTFITEKTRVVTDEEISETDLTN